MAHRLLTDVIVRSDYVIRYEQYDDFTLGHVEVTRWTPQVARQIRRDVDVAMSLRNSPIHALSQPDNRKLQKFLRSLGFTPCGEANDNQGRPHVLYVRMRTP
jgi:predicted GNAT family N-acyltransferase